MSQANVPDAFRGNGQHQDSFGVVPPGAGITAQPEIHTELYPSTPLSAQDPLLSMSMLVEHHVQIVRPDLFERQRAFEPQVMERLSRQEPLARRPDEAVSPFVPDRLTGPIQFIRKLAEVWNLDAATMTAVLGYEQDEQRNVEGLLAGRSSVRGRDLKDRITALVRIRSLLNNLFRDPNAERLWMRTPRAELEGHSPLDLVRDGSMERLLTLRQYVEHISRL